ncbi:MAG TPA: hypothetical protein VK169_02070 [Saprospiraceae bacterium]|nr:hypothetical protein [Saprospiraceae bacterium]
MKSYVFDFTKQNNAKLVYNETFDPNLRGWKMTFEEFKKEIEAYDAFEPWIINNDLKYERFDIEKHDIAGWTRFEYYLKNEDKDYPYEASFIGYSFELHGYIQFVTYKSRIDDWYVAYNIAQKLGFNLYCSDLNRFITLEYLNTLKEKSKSKGPKLTQKQEDVLSEVDNDAAWIYIPTDKTQEIISYVGASSKESEIVSGLYKAFEKDFSGLATYQSHSIIFGKNLMTLSLPDLKNTPKPVNDDIMHHVIWNLSIRFGDAQFYSYNEYEVWYIHYKNGELVYSGTNGDDGPSYVAGSITEEIELSDSKVKELAEENGIAIEDFLIGCMKDKIKCHLTEAQNGMQVWWDGIMDQVKKELKSKKS